MKFLEKLEKIVSKFAIRDLMKYIMLGSFFVYIMDMLTSNFISGILGFSKALILEGQIWRVITFIFVPWQGSLFILITFFFYFFIGRTLESIWGVARFNLYYILGVIFTVIGGFIFGYATTYYLNLTLFLAYAVTLPDSYVNLYFVIPIKVKYLGFVYAAFLLIDFIRIDSISSRAAMVISLLNFIIFFGPDFFKESKRRKKTNEMRKKIRDAKIKTKNKPIHKCTVCGITEKDDPNMEFRYCTKCVGNFEYCEKHIRNHEHRDNVVNLDQNRK